jgi:TolB-like protein
MLKFLPLLFFLSSCIFGPGNFKSSHSSDLGARRVKRIAILPPASVKESDPNSVLIQQLYSIMPTFPNWQIVSDREVKEFALMAGQGSESVRAKRLGELVYADAVISGRVLRYRERVGEEWGIKDPASVAFVLELWDVKQGDIIWSARFDETQKPLSENIFAIGEFAQRGARWLSAEELMLEGVKKAVQQLHKVLHAA